MCLLSQACWTLRHSSHEIIDFVAVHMLSSYYHSNMVSGLYVWSIIMMTSPNGNNFHITGFCEGKPPVTSRFPSQKPVTSSFDVFFHLHLKKRLSKLSRCWWFETPWRSLWRHYDVLSLFCGVATTKSCTDHCEACCRMMREKLKKNPTSQATIDDPWSIYPHCGILTYQ